MKVAPYHSQVTPPPKRKENESVVDYIARSGLDPIHAPLIFSMVEELHMTTEVALAHALAMFNAVQDMCYFHYPVIKLDPFQIDAVQPSLAKGNGYEINAALKKNYFPVRNGIVRSAISHLQIIQEKLNNGEISNVEEAVNYSFETKGNIKKDGIQMRKSKAREQKKAAVLEKAMEKRKKACSSSFVLENLKFNK